jgi:membrane-associated phospholipid phosphatase
MTLPQRDRLPRASSTHVSATARLRAAAAGFWDSWRRPRPERETKLRHAEAGIVLVIIAATLVLAWYGDAAATLWARSLNPNLVWVFQRITKLGDSGYIFATAAIVIIGSVLLQGRGRGRRFDVALGHIAGRATFVLGVNAVAGLLSLVLKAVFGRARPRFFDLVGPFHFDTFVFNASYASFPSGHSITAFGTAMALSYFLPRWRWPLLGLALTIGVSRVIVGAHYPSDVVAGAAIGIGTAIFLRRAFLRRRLVFRHTAQGLQPRGHGRIASHLRRWPHP